MNKSLSYRIFFKITHDKSLMLSFLLCSQANVLDIASGNLWFLVTPRKILTFTKFLFLPESLFSSIQCSMESSPVNVVTFVHWVGEVGGVLLSFRGNSLRVYKYFSPCEAASFSSNFSVTFFLLYSSSL